MARKQSSRPIDILAAAAADSGSGSESKKLSGSDPKPIEEDSPAINRKSSRKRSLPKHRVLDESEGSIKNARVSSVNRLWSESDEIGILQGMIDFRVRKGQDPYSDRTAFLEFVQDSINVHGSKKQLFDKIRRLKNKYLADSQIGNVVDVVKPHDGRLFKLSEMIWGGDGTVGVTNDVVENGNVPAVENGGIEVDDDEEEGEDVVQNGKVDVVENGIEVDDDEEEEGEDVVRNGKVDVVENGIEVDDEEEGGNVVENGLNGKVDVVSKGKDFKEMYPYLSKGWESDVSCSPLLKNYLMDNIHLLGSVQLREMDKKWKNTYVDQLKLYVKRLDLVKKHAQLVLDQLATSDS